MNEVQEICTICGLPKNLCVCKEISRETQKIKITVERTRYRKILTMVTGIEDKERIEELARLLKKKLACGGTAKKNAIELQGNHKEKVKQILLQEGYKKEQFEE